MSADDKRRVIAGYPAQKGAEAVESYQYSSDQCSVENQERLNRYRQHRSRWLGWLHTDEHHAIADVIYSMVWNDVSFRAIAQIADTDANSALSNGLITESLVNGHFAIQILAVRRLMDRTRGVISLYKLLEDMMRKRRDITREVFVSYDGLPYDYEAAEQEIIRERSGKGAFWGDYTGPKAWATSERAHRVFDDLSGVAADKRQRIDLIRVDVFSKLFAWLSAEEVNDLVKWSHTFLAHAGSGDERVVIAERVPSLNKITASIKIFVKVIDVVSAYLLFDKAMGNVMPVPQYNPFEGLDKPILKRDFHLQLDEYWQKLSDERDKFNEASFTELMK